MAGMLILADTSIRLLDKRSKQANIDFFHCAYMHVARMPVLLRLFCGEKLSCRSATLEFDIDLIVPSFSFGW